MSDLLERSDLIRISRILFPDWSAQGRDGPLRPVRAVLTGAPNFATGAETTRIKELAARMCSRAHLSRRVRVAGVQEVAP